MSQNILGDKRKSNFDDNLADVVNKIFDEAEKLEKLKAKTVEPQKEDIKKPDNLGERRMILARDDYPRKTPEEWTDIYMKSFNVTFASLPDVYRTFKTFKRWSEHGIPDCELGEPDRVANSIQYLKKTFTLTNQLVTSTKLKYYPAQQSPTQQLSTQCCITHYAGFGPAMEKTTWRNHFDSKSVWSLAQTAEGVDFLKALLDTQDSENEIMDVWEWVGGCFASDILVITPPLSKIHDVTPDKWGNCALPLPAYATLKVDNECLYGSEPKIIIHLEKSPLEKGCAREVLRK
ncbi:hypothetical protein HZA97_01130 [Candidatus Woesearchaeota archaeon]|nr:hypothetical protein [Candidatus Woesearchaeota archaeon]